MQIELFQAIIIVATSVGSALLALILLAAFASRKTGSELRVATHPVLEQTVFLFDDQDLVDATAPARALLEASPMAASDWARLSAFVAPRFDDFAKAMSQLAERGRVELISKPEEGRQTPIRLIAEEV